MKLPPAFATLPGRLRALIGQGLRLRLALCALSVCASLVAVWIANDAAATAGRRLDQARAQQRRATAELDTARIFDQRLGTAVARYRTMADQGVADGTAGTAWQAALTRTLARPGASASGSRPALAVRPGPLRTLADAGTTGTLPASGRAPALQLTAKPLHLDAAFRHEGELADLLAQLEAESGRRLLIRGCRLERLPPAAADDGSPTLQANCLLEALAIVPHAEAQP